MTGAIGRGDPRGKESCTSVVYARPSRPLTLFVSRRRPMSAVTPSAPMGWFPSSGRLRGTCKKYPPGTKRLPAGSWPRRRLSVRRKGRRIELIISAPRRQGGVLVGSLSNLRGEGALGPRTTLDLRQEATVRKLEPDLRQHPPAAHQFQTQAAILRRVRRLRL